MPGTVLAVVCVAYVLGGKGYFHLIDEEAEV